MKIIWVADNSIKDHPGGAQITNNLMIEFGRKLGYTILEWTKNGGETFEESKHDLFIINNINELYIKNKAIFEDIVENKTFVRYVHDYDWVYGTIPETFIAKMFSKSKINIFLSPLHFKRTKMTGLPIDNHAIIPPQISLRAQSGGTRRSNFVIYTGGIATHKGITNIINYALLNPHLTFHLYGWVENSSIVKRLPNNVKVFEPIKHDGIYARLRDYEYFIHLPLWNEPFGRSVAEAYLAGCKLITNGKVGFQSFDWNYSDTNMVANKLAMSPNVFWDTVTKFI